MDLKVLIGNFSILLVTTVTSYLLLVLLFRRKIISLYDPLHVGIVIMSFYLNFLALPYYIDVGRTYFILAAYLLLFFLGGLFVKGGGVSKNKYLSADVRVVRFISWAILCVFLANFAFNVLAVGAPILTGQGSDARYLLGQNSRVLTWLVASVNSVPLLFLVFCDDRHAARVNLSSLFVLFLTGVAAANKSSLLTVIILFVTYVFLLSLRGKVLSRRAKWFGWTTTIISLLLFPYYLLVARVAVDPSMALMAILQRLAGGFDQLAFMSAYNNVDPGSGPGLLLIYFLPLLKALLGIHAEYNTYVDYFFSYYLGKDTSIGMYPNSNLAMEMFFAYPIWLGAGFMLIIGYTSFRVRRAMLQKVRLTIFDLFVFQFFVLSPFYWLLDGQRFVATFYSSFFVYMLVFFVVNIPRIIARLSVKIV